MSVAKSYARAIFEAARDQGVAGAELDRIESQMLELRRAMEGSQELRIALTGPATSSREKVSLVRELSKKGGYATIFGNFLELVARKGRLDLLPEMHDAFSAVRLEAEGGIRGTLVSADPVDQAAVEGLAQSFRQKLGKKVAFRTETDPSLLAGIKVTVSGVTYDGTLRSQLQRLRDRLVYDTGATH